LIFKFIFENKFYFLIKIIEYYNKRFDSKFVNLINDCKFYWPLSFLLPIRNGSYIILEWEEILGWKRHFMGGHEVQPWRVFFEVVLKIFF